MIEDISLAHPFLNLGQLQSQTRTNLRITLQNSAAIRAPLKLQWHTVSHIPLSNGPRSVVMPCCLFPSRPVAAQLCCVLHLVQLHFLKGSPPWKWLEGVLLEQATNVQSGSNNRAFIRSLLHQQLADILKLVHIREFLLHELLYSTAHSYRDHLKAAAGGEQNQICQFDSSSADKKFFLYYFTESWPISAFTLDNASLNSHVIVCHHMSPYKRTAISI